LLKQVREAGGSLQSAKLLPPKHHYRPEIALFPIHF
jgi:hypothetical protein